jgi:hypothetical protein
MIVCRLLLVALLAAFEAQPVFSHSGGTNADGCHTNHRTGDYHCHNPKPQVPGRVTYCHVVDGERRCGYARSTCNDLVSTEGGSCQQEY